jgi:hypothetical protein
MSQTRQRAAFDYLLQQFAASAGQSAAQRCAHSQHPGGCVREDVLHGLLT